jgi:hypothetical protein
MRSNTNFEFAPIHTGGRRAEPASDTTRSVEVDELA